MKTPKRLKQAGHEREQRQTKNWELEAWKTKLGNSENTELGA